MPPKLEVGGRMLSFPFSRFLYISCKKPQEEIWHFGTGNLSLYDRSKRTAQCWVCNWSLLASHSGLWASPPPQTMSTNANKPVGEASSNPVLRCSVALVVLT